MSQNYQSQDVWSRATSVNGYAFDELRSVLQKSIRRGWIEEAVLAAFEFFSSGPEAEEVLWRRLEIIAAEDVGFGLMEAPAILEALNAQRLRMVDRGDRWMYSVHAVRLLATAKKDNTTMELATVGSVGCRSRRAPGRSAGFSCGHAYPPGCGYGPGCRSLVDGRRETGEQARPRAHQVGPVSGRSLHGKKGAGGEELIGRFSGSAPAPASPPRRQRCTAQPRASWPPGWLPRPVPSQRLGW